MQATGHESERFIGFKTLHAMAFWLMGKSHDDITNYFDSSEIAYLPKHVENTVAKERTKMYAQLYNFHRMTGRDLSDVWAGYGGRNTGTEEDFLEWILLYNKHKKALSKIDFVDLIQEFVDRKIAFPFQYLFIDEAQDFSLDQWGAAAILARHAQHVIVAGDADQSVFGWSGAKSCMFDELEGRKIVLSQSFRLPSRPFTYASRVLAAMARVVLYRPTEIQGGVHFLFQDEINALPLDNGETWFILCRNNYSVERLTRWMFKRQVMFRPVSDAGEGPRISKFIRYIEWYEAAIESGAITARRRKILSKEASNFDDSFLRKLPWWKVFDTWPIDRIEYLLATRPNWHSPKVAIGTFHASKGAEADNVVLLGDCTRRITAAIERNEPEELRAIYVAMTRTKNNLFLVQPTGRNGIQWSKFQRLPEDLTNGLL